MDEGEEGRGEFIVAGGDPSELFEFVEKAFDEIAFLVEVGVVVALDDAVAFGWDDRDFAGVEDVVGVVSLVGDECVDGKSLNEVEGLGIVAGLTGSQDEAQGIAQGIAQGVDFGGEASFASA